MYRSEITSKIQIRNQKIPSTPESGTTEVSVTTYVFRSLGMPTEPQNRNTKFAECLTQAHLVVFS